MITKVDWVSFSLHLPGERGTDERYTEDAVIEALIQLHPMLDQWLDIYDTWSRTKGRAPYSVAWQHPSGGITIFYHPRLDHCLIEVSGKGCDFLHSNNRLESLLQATANRVTRVDIACDALCDTVPSEFAEKRDLGRFKSHSQVVSESGSTYYVGSRTSNRYARVYRYNPPHERAPFLRIEHVVKSDDAKILVKALLRDGILAVASTLGKTFGWTHETWKPEDVTPSEIKAYRAERHEGKTLFWLADTVAPVILRLHRDGTIDLETWLNENVYSKLNADELSAIGRIPF